MHYRQFGFGPEQLWLVKREVYPVSFPGAGGSWTSVHLPPLALLAEGSRPWPLMIVTQDTTCKQCLETSLIQNWHHCKVQCRHSSLGSLATSNFRHPCYRSLQRKYQMIYCRLTLSSEFRTLGRKNEDVPRPLSVWSSDWLAKNLRARCLHAHALPLLRRMVVTADSHSEKTAT